MTCRNSSVESCNDKILFKLLLFSYGHIYKRYQKEVILPLQKGSFLTLREVRPEEDSRGIDTCWIVDIFIVFSSVFKFELCP